MFEAIGAFFATFFVLGGFWFWVLFVAYFGAIVALADHEENFWAAAITGGFLFGVFQFNPTETFNWGLVPWFIIGYLILGAVMSFTKWIMYLKKRARKYADLKEDWVETSASKLGPLPTIEKGTNMKQVLTNEQYDNFAKYLQHEGFINYKETRIIPRWKDKYKKLVSWALWWPAVIFWAVLNDYIIGAFNTMVRAMRGWYDNIASKVFSAVGVSASDNEDMNSRY